MYVIPFLQIKNKHLEQVGKKGLSLGAMYKAKFPVPEGFVIKADAFKRFLKESGVLVTINAELAKVSLDEMHSVDYASRVIMDQIIGAEMPNAIAVEIMQQFTTVDSDFMAVRASAIAEEIQVSWSGELATFLNVDASNLPDRIKECWASLYSTRSIYYLLKHKRSFSEINIAVVVQKMIDSKVSGVVYTAHPVTRDKNQMVIEAGLGLGEAIVERKISPDTYDVQKDPYEIINKKVNAQFIRVDTQRGSGTRTNEVAVKLGKKQKLTDKQIGELTKLCIKLEEYYKSPLNIEWALEDKFFILQAREMTNI